MSGDPLVAEARAAIAAELGVPVPEFPRRYPASHSLPAHGQQVQPAVATSEPGAAFVTLTLDGRLRGCIGSLTAYRPLLDDVRSNARAAAFRDPRFSPLTREEFARVDVEVSVLTPAEPMSFSSEEHLLAQLIPHVDGLVLEASGRRGTFLPQVWDQLPDPRDFVAHLKRKAGLPETYWGPDVRVSRYRVTKHTDDG